MRSKVKIKKRRSVSKALSKSHLPKGFKPIKIAEDVYLIPYNGDKIYKSLLVKLKRIYFSAYQGHEELSYQKPRHVKKYIKWLIQRCGKHFYIIAYGKEKKIIGFLALELNWYDPVLKEKGAHLQEFVIDKSHQSHGIGRKVLEYVLKEIRKYNVKKIILTVGEKNIKAIKFYKSLGFKAIQKDVSEKQKSGVVWIYMIKEV